MCKCIITVMLHIFSTRVKCSHPNILKGFSRKIITNCEVPLKHIRVENRGFQGNVCFPKVKNSCAYAALNSELFVKVVQNTGHVSFFKAFHTTECRKAIPFWLGITLRVLSKGLAMLSGRYLRRQWKKASPQRKMEMVLTVKRNKNVWLGLTLFMTLGSAYFYISHLEEDPITKRSKFIMFDSEQIMQLADIELEVQTAIYKSRFLPPSHPLYLKLAGLVKHLLSANKDIAALKDKDWKITVVDAPEITNAFALPNGTIFVFTGILNVCSNDDQLGIVLAHEIAHVVLSHMTEQISNAYLMDFLWIIPLFLLWTLLPDGGAFITQWLSGYITNLVIHLPFSRSLESEADTVGLQLAAKACFDVREASVFWRKMHMITENSAEADVEWLSTHPSGETRQQHLDSIMTEAIGLREKAKCPHFPILDPRFLTPGEETSLRHVKKHMKQVPNRNV